MKKRLIQFLVVLLGSTYNLYALTVQQQLAQNAIVKYYETLEILSNSPNPIIEQQIVELFDVDGFVYNDLYSLESEYANGLIKENQEANISEYMGTIRNIWSTSEIQLRIRGEIDLSSFIEEKDPDYKDAGLKAVWVTATKYISMQGKPVNGKGGTKETFKIKNGKIQSVRTPDKSTAIINALRSYNRGDYEKAYYGFIQQINNNTADDDTYFYLGLMFKEGKNICKKLYPSSDLRDKLCVFYWMKSRRGHKALFHYKVYTYHHPDYKKINHPFQCGLMTVYKGNGDLYGYMDEKGKMAIPYKYRLAYSFSEKNKVAIVLSHKRKWGVINKYGDTLVDFIYDKIEIDDAKGIVKVYTGNNEKLIPIDNFKNR